jgi:hypothetical protein
VWILIRISIRLSDGASMVRFPKAVMVALICLASLSPAWSAETLQLAGPKRGPSENQTHEPLAVHEAGPTKSPSHPATAAPPIQKPQSPPPPAAEPTDENDKFRQRYTQVLDDIFRGIYEGDYTRFSRNLSEQMRASQTRQSFLQLQTKVQTRLGKLSSMEYLGYYSQGRYTMVLFKAKFAKDRNDVLITLVSEKKAAQPTVAGLWMDSPVLEK